MLRARFLCLAAIAFASNLASSEITTPKKFFGHDIGADYELPNYQQLSAYWKVLGKESNRIAVQSIGKTAEGRDQLMAIVSSPGNLRRREMYRQIAEKLCRAEKLTDAEALKLSKEGKAVVWIDGGLHANEVLGAQQLIETVYQMVSRNDDEVQRILANVIILFTHANPDGMELVSDWYMREKDPKKRNLNIPRLYQKYIGHDNNRDFYMVSQPETQNMCNVMYRQWYPQIIYNHHQTGPRGTVLFCPPFRDPFNHNVDPQTITGTDLVGMAIHNRFLMEGKPGATMRSGSPYSTWWNGGLRTTAYFHNMIGILTETIGNPTPMSIPFVAEKLTPQGKMPFPPQPQEWHFRQSIDYSVTANMAILDLAARQREEFLYGIYTMGKRQVALGSKDSWIDTPSRTAVAKSLADLRKPELRSPRAYIIPSDQPDFLTARKFINCLLFVGVEVQAANRSFTYSGKTYPEGSLVVRTDQPFRPHVLDMFEPQDHPNDIPAPGAAPIPPYDSAGYTLALQMGVKFDRILEPFPDRFPLVTTPAVEMELPRSPDTAINNSFKWAFERLAKREQTYESERSFFTAPPAVGTAIRLNPVRVALWDTYGGSIDSGWMRFVFEKFSVPFKVAYPKEFERDDLKHDFDVLVFVNGAISAAASRRSRTANVPEEFAHMTGSITDDTIPHLRKFLEDGGTIITLGGSTSLARKLGLGVSNHLVEDGKAIPREQFYIPGSIMSVSLNRLLPVTWGMESKLDTMFDNSPVFKIKGKDIQPIGTYDSKETLRSGWAWGQEYLEGGVAMAQAKVGKGTLFLFGPELNYRSQSQASFKLIFNAIIQTGATP